MEMNQFRYFIIRGPIWNVKSEDTKLSVPFYLPHEVSVLLFYFTVNFIIQTECIGFNARFWLLCI